MRTTDRIRAQLVPLPDDPEETARFIAEAKARGQMVVLPLPPALDQMVHDIVCLAMPDERPKTMDPGDVVQRMSVACRLVMHWLKEHGYTIIPPTR